MVKLPLSYLISPPILPPEMGEVWSQIFIECRFYLGWPCIFHLARALFKMKNITINSYSRTGVNQDCAEKTGSCDHPTLTQHKTTSFLHSIVFQSHSWTLPCLHHFLLCLFMSPMWRTSISQTTGSQSLKFFTVASSHMKSTINSAHLIKIN